MTDIPTTGPPGDGNGREPRRRRSRAWVVLAALTAVLLGAGTALAAVAAAPNANQIGAAGYDATTADPLGFTDNQAVENADQYALQVSGGRLGVKMCNGTSHESAAIGEFSGNTNTTYAVQYGTGVAPDCPAGQIPAADLHTFPALSNVPFGHHVWVDERVITKVKTIRLLVCVLVNKHNGHPAPTPTATQPTPGITPSVSQPTASPTSESPSAPPTDISGSGGTEVPSESPSVSQPTASPTGTEPVVTPTVNPNGSVSLGIPGFTLKCHIVTKTIRKHVLLFQAQDLDAPVATPLAGDLAGVQVATIPFGSPTLPNGTIFDHANNGSTENLSLLTPCAGAGFPTALAGPAAYDSAACQPLVVFEFAAAAPGAGPPQDFQALTTTEVISRTPATSANANALMAPDNSITATNLGPHGPVASGAVIAGSHYVDFSGNVSLTPAPSPAGPA